MAKKAKTQAAGPRKQLDKEGKFTVCEIYSKPPKTVFFNRGRGQKDFPEITLEGFQGLPTGLYLNRNGYGFGKRGVVLLDALKRHLAPNNPIELTISKTKKTSVRKKGAKVAVNLHFNQVRDVLTKFARINADRNSELNQTADAFLSAQFPTRIKVAVGSYDQYQPGEIAALLRRKGLIKKLNQDDMDELANFIPELSSSPLKGRPKVLRSARDQLVLKTKDAANRIFLDDVIKEFKTMLAKGTVKEDKWQTFLRDKVLRYLANYVATIEKQNVSLSVSYPDFVMVDVFEFIDVFEIKRHDTELLAYDDSRKNYYWKPEIARAISQIENYIDEVVRNALQYAQDVQRKVGINLQVVRPRGFIIAGTMKQLKTKKEQEDFRRLSAALKNIDFIVYDELVAQLENLRKKL